jgi:hypothetical protein
MNAERVVEELTHLYSERRSGRRARKFGVTKSPATRYTQEQLVDGSVAYHCQGITQ